MKYTITIKNDFFFGEVDVYRDTPMTEEDILLIQSQTTVSGLTAILPERSTVRLTFASGVTLYTWNAPPDTSGVSYE